MPAKRSLPETILAHPQCTPVGMTTVPVLRKFRQYKKSVTQFEIWRLPWLEAAVHRTTHGTVRTFDSPATMEGQRTTEDDKYWLSG